MSVPSDSQDVQRSITELKNAHQGQDLWVIAAGASMDYVDPAFFEGKVTIGVNRVNRRFDCDYILAKDSRGFDELMQFRKRAQFVFSRYESGDPGGQLNTIEGPHWVFDHPQKLDRQSPDLTAIGTDRIVVSYSTITSAMHFAAYLGARSIIVCGHDCGAINGATSFSEYYTGIAPVQGSDMAYYEWLGEIEQQSISVIEALRRVYGVHIHSLNPFLNLNLEGNTFESLNSSDHESRMLAAEREDRRQEQEAHRKERHDFQYQVQQLEKQAHELRTSRSFRLGNRLLSCFRWLVPEEERNN